MMSLKEKNRTYPLLSCGVDSKTVKGEKLSIMTGILYLAPHKEAGIGNFCGNASPGCIKTCLFTAGRARVHPAINKGRIRKTLFFASDREGFNARLYKDIRNLINRAKRENMFPAIRLDGTSDIGIATEICKDFPEVMFYDYTKSRRRMEDFLAGRFPRNYHLTFSRSELNDSDCVELLAKGAGVAIVFDDDPSKVLPEKYFETVVINGDESDSRFLDRKVFNIPDNEGYIISLKAKGKAKKDTSGFVIRG